MKLEGTAARDTAMALMGLGFAAFMLYCFSRFDELEGQLLGLRTMTILERMAQSEGGQDA